MKSRTSRSRADALLAIAGVVCLVYVAAIATGMLVLHDHLVWYTSGGVPIHVRASRYTVNIHWFRFDPEHIGLSPEFRIIPRDPPEMAVALGGGWVEDDSFVDALAGMSLVRSLRVNLIVAAIAPAGLLILLGRAHERARRTRRGICANCRYDLAGLPIRATCPECGTTDPALMIARARTVARERNKTAGR
ncbi:MAG: hypothetical protein AB7G11_10200 [Phycisphaerales bacterium]